MQSLTPIENSRIKDEINDITAEELDYLQSIWYEVIRHIRAQELGCNLLKTFTHQTIQNTIILLVRKNNEMPSDAGLIAPLVITAYLNYRSNGNG